MNQQSPQACGLCYSSASQHGILEQVATQL